MNERCEEHHHVGVFAGADTDRLELETAGNPVGCVLAAKDAIEKTAAIVLKKGNENSDVQE